TACFKICCLSAIDRELSTARRRSTRSVLPEVRRSAGWSHVDELPPPPGFPPTLVTSSPHAASEASEATSRTNAKGVSRRLPLNERKRIGVILSAFLGFRLEEAPLERVNGPTT